MTATTRFIEDAIKGGWKPIKLNRAYDDSKFEQGSIEETYQIDAKHTLLDPLAWQSVGKMRGWKERSDDYQWWKVHWHTFITHLADGKSVEESLQALEAKTESHE